MKKAFTIIVLIIFLAAAVFIVLILSGVLSPVSPSYSCPLFERTPISNPYFQRLWSRPGIAIYPDRFDLPMQGVGSKVLVLTGQDFEYGGSKLLAFDTQSGNVLWQKYVTLPVSLITGYSELYTGIYNKIEIVDAQSGNLVKVIEVPKAGNIYNMFATEHNLYAFISSGRWLTYNIGDGTFILSEPFLPYTPFLIEDGILYFHDAGAYKAKQIETQSILWEYSLDSYISSYPQFTDKMIILLTTIGNIYGLDKTTGELLWERDAHAISNVAVNRSQLYFLTDDGYLRVLDMKSGQEIAKLAFEPSSFELSNPSSENIIGAYNIWVDSENDILTVSFGDSCQLMGFKLETP